MAKEKSAEDQPSPTGEERDQMNESLPEMHTEAEETAAQAETDTIAPLDEIADSVLISEAGSNRATREWAGSEAGKKFHEEDLPEIERQQQEITDAYEKQLNSGEQIR